MVADAPVLPPDIDERGLSAGPWRRVRRGLGALAAITLIVALGIVGWTWRHPSAFDAYSGGGGSGISRVGANRPAYFGVSYPSSGTVHLDNLKPDVVSNGAHATFAFVICHIDPTDPTASLLAAGRPRDVRDNCARVTRAIGSSLDLGVNAGEQLLMEVIPAQAGVVRIAGVEATYSFGWQHGTPSTSGLTSSPPAVRCAPWSSARGRRTEAASVA
jgi:hypothetical protein